ncbi:acyltransferase family protein [Janibacter sp. G349]|uniref:acyltransferase family protein n=1 Tax=Janibacter sp. G349 TaxID=3405424 RepID=UPI003B7857C3
MRALTASLKTSTGEQRLAALDGYRGLFVTLVLLYHFGATFLVGGWVGINHFFAFSGYLITRLLISERARTGGIDVLRFYRRRAERLLPALVAVCTAVLVASLFAGSANRHRDAGDVLASLFFVQNWRLISQDDAYFEQVGNPSPLRHAWTLGVEEQFYLLVPLLVLVLFAVWRTSRTARVVALAALALASAAWTAHLARSGVDFARLYYGTDTRAQALLVGAVVAALLGRDHRGRLGRRPSAGVTQAIGLVGFLVSLSAFVVVGPRSEWLFTSGGMLFFAVGAAMMGLAATDPRPLLINRVASWGPAVLLGQMTYGLYLYHWPIHLWLGPLLDPLPLVVSVLAQLAVTVGVAYASFRWLEVPVLQHGFGALLPHALRPAPRARSGRAARRARRRGAPVWAVPVAAVAVVAVLAGFVFTRPVSEADLEVPPLVAADADPAPADPPVDMALLGDSVGVSLGKGWRAEDHPGVTMTNLSRIGCDLVDAPLLADGSPMPEDESCDEWRRDWPQQVEEAGATDLLVLPGPQLIGEHEVDGRTVGSRSDEHAALVTETLDEIERRAHEAGVTHVQVATMPCREVDPDKLDPSLRQFAGPISDPANVGWVNDVVRDWARGEGGSRGTKGVDRQVLDLWEPLCGDGYREEIKGVPLYSDTVHFSPAGAAMVWTWLTPRVVEASRS